MACPTFNLSWDIYISIESPSHEKQHDIKRKLSTAKLWPFVHRYMEKEDRGIVLLLFQSIMGSSRLDGYDEVWKHLNKI